MHVTHPRQGAAARHGPRPALMLAAMAWWSWHRVKSDTAIAITRKVQLLNEHAWRRLQSEERGYATGLNLKSRSGLSISSLRRIAGSGA
jgi:hypothetical protein